jgi:protein TonB
MPDRLHPTQESAPPARGAHRSSTALAALTRDEALAGTLRSVLTAERDLVVVRSEIELGEQLVTTRAAVALIDAAAAATPLAQLTEHLRREFPDLVLVVAGDGAAQHAVSAQVTSGAIYRFLHKPVSEQRVKLFVEAAMRRHDEEKERELAGAAAAPTVRFERMESSRFSGAKIAAGVIGAAVLAIGGWFFFRADEPSAPEAQQPSQAASTGASEAPPTAPETAGGASATPSQPAPATAAPERAAARDPAASAAARELEDLLNRAEAAVVAERYDDAERLVSRASALAPDNVRVAFLSAQLGKQRERELLAAEARRTLERQQREQRVEELLGLATERFASGSLIEPVRDNARFYLDLAAELDSGNAAVVAARRQLIERLLQLARENAARGAFDAAQGWLSTAEQSGARRAELAEARREVEAARVAADQARRARARELLDGARGAVARADFESAERLLAQAEEGGAAVADVGAVRAELETSRTRRRESEAFVPASALEQTRYVEPRYPAAARAQNLAGWVEVELTVATDGAVKGVRVLRGDPPGVFDEAAIEAVSKWRYRPVMREGRAVEQRARLRMRFQLE